MNKGELIQAVAEKSGLSKTDTASAIDSLLDVITESLKKKQDIRLIGFGTFSVSHRKATQGRNPQTGAPIQLKASYQPKFKAGKGLKDAVN